MIQSLSGNAIDAIALDNEIMPALEDGNVIYLPDLQFAFKAEEQDLLTPLILPQAAKNISYDPRNQQLKAFDSSHASYLPLQQMLQRYATFAENLVKRLLPRYTEAVTLARTSYRPVEIAGREAPSFRKDDSRLHVDAFPASPNQGRQLLRVFSNVNPTQQPRIWRVGEPFEQVARHFKDKLTLPYPLTAKLLQTLRITRGLRTPYDALMLQLHDCMKADECYQATVAQQQVALKGTWIVFTDQVSHAAMRGQYCLEQTFMLPVAARANPATSPLKVLERLFGRELV